MRLVLGLGAVLSAVLLAGCGPNCQAVCTKMAHECPELSDLRAGYSDDEAFDECVTECEGALDDPGDLSGYDPMERNTSGESMHLNNEKQAAVWMDCVDEMSCDRLADGYCAPVY